MKKICFITTIPLTIEAFVLKTMEYLHEVHGWDVSVICNTDKNFAEQLPEYIHYFPIPMERGVSVAGISAIIKMWKIFKREKFDIIQYSTPNASLYASIAGLLSRVPVRLYCQWGIAYVGFSGLKRRIFKCVEKIICTLSTWIEPDSNSNLEFAHNEKLYQNNKGSVIWNGSACGINLEKFNINQKEVFRKKIRDRYDISEDSFVYGFVGRITRDKGVNELLQAFKTIHLCRPDIYLMMVGSSEVDETINQELYSWSQNCEHVIYTGYTNRVEMYLSAMDIFILPSYREGFGMGVVEAEAMGVPVIVSNIPGPIDAMCAEDTGIVVEKKDINALISAMERITDRELIEKFAVNGVSFAVKNFEQKKLLEEIAIDREKLLRKSR